MIDNSLLTTPWQAGRLDERSGPPELLFGRMYEDWRIEAGVFPRGARVFCVASAGCTAMALARLGYEVVAVDINPVQVAYVRERLAGAPVRAGRVERPMELVRRTLPLVGIRPALLREFLLLEDTGRQLRFFREKLDTGWRRGLLRMALSRPALRTVYGPGLLRMVPPHFSRVVHSRMERMFATHPNRTNEFAWRMLFGCEPPGAIPDEKPVALSELNCAEAAEYLQNCPPGSFDAFSLSNILDATEEHWGRRLLAAVRHAAGPEAVMVLRSFAEPDRPERAEWARRDCSGIWGGIRLELIGGDGHALPPEAASLYGGSRVPALRGADVRTA